MSVERYDVLIAGAGPAGCATALALAQAGVAVLLLDRPLAQPFLIGESATPDVAGLLSRLGVGHKLDGHVPYHGNVSLWGGDVPQLDHFLFRAQGHGWHLDRAAFDHALRQAALEQDIAIQTPSGVDHIAPDHRGWRVQVRGLGEVVTRVVVDAGGRRSPLATRMGIQRCQVDRLQALACHATASEALSGYSLVESCSHGWWYATGLPDGRALVTLMTDQDIAKAHKLHDPECYLAAWRETRLLAERVPPPGHASPVQAFAAHSGCINHAAGLGHAAGQGWICVGDALMGLDPLTSSGISGALRDALAAAPAILGMLEGNTAAARAYALRANGSFKRYLAERQQHYSLESRWANWPFWQRRMPSPSLSPTIVTDAA